MEKKSRGRKKILNFVSKNSTPDLDQRKNKVSNYEFLVYKIIHFYFIVIYALNKISNHTQRSLISLLLQNYFH